MKNIFNFFKKIYEKSDIKNNYFSNFSISNNKSYFSDTPKESLRSYTNFVYVSICCDSICRYALKNKYYFKDDNGNKIEKEKISEDIIMPFKNGFYNDDFYDLLKLVLYHKLLTGNGYLKKERNSLYSSYKNSYDQFIPIFPDEIRPIISRDGKKLLYYEIKKKDGTREIIDKEEIIHFKQNAIFNPFLGIGNITKMRLLAEGELAGQLFNNEFMNNKAFPSVIFSDETPIRPGDYERNYELIQNRFKAANGKAFYVNGTNFKIHQLNPSYQDMQFLEQRKYNEESIYELFGYYKLKDTTNRATAEIKRLKYLENTINPIIYDIEKTINHQYLRIFEKNNNISFKIDKYKTNDVENIIKMLNNGIITPNRASELLGEDFDVNSYERSSFYMPLNLVPIGTVTNSNENVDKNSDNKLLNNSDDCKYVDVADPKNVNAIVGHLFKNSRRNKYFQTKFLRKALTTRNKIEDKFIFSFKKFFNNQKKRVLEKINNNYKDLKNINICKKDIYDNENLSIFFSIKDEDKYIRKIVGDLHERTIDDSITDINNLVNSNISHSNNVMNYLKESLGAQIVGENAKNNINKFTQKKVYDAIIYSVNNNFTINEIQEEISRIFKSFENYRTRRIARTESRTAWDAAASETYKELDVKKVDVVGCTQFEPDSDCGKKGILLTEVLNLRFHPNHIGALAPEIEP